MTTYDDEMAAAIGEMNDEIKAALLVVQSKNFSYDIVYKNYDRTTDRYFYMFVKTYKGKIDSFLEVFSDGSIRTRN